LKDHGVPVPHNPPLEDSCSAAAPAATDGQAHAAVISSYALPLLTGRGAIDHPTEVWSHPALLGRRLYIRGKRELLCLDLGERRQKRTEAQQTTPPAQHQTPPRPPTRPPAPL